MKFPFRLATLSGLLGVALLSSGCSTMGSRMPSLPDQSPSLDAQSGAPARTDIPLDWDTSSLFLLEPPETNSTGLPKKRIANLSFSELGVTDAVRTVAAEAGLTLRLEGGSLGSQRYGAFTIENLSGTLEEVLTQMSEAAGFFWEVQGRTLLVRQDARFIVQLPPVFAEDTLAGMANTMQALGARDIYLNRSDRTLAFSTNVKGMHQIKRYLDKVRQTRSLLVYDVNVYQVELNDGMNTGIQWNSFKALSAADPVAKTFGITNESTGLGLSFTSQHFSMGALVQFLNTQGTVKSLSSPQIALLSGTKGSLRVGKTTQYVSKVGSNTTTGISQVTTETQSLRTGLSLVLQGDMYDQTVFTRLGLSISEVTERVKFQAVGTQLELPQTADRDLDVNVRTRPGDVLVLAGIHTESDTTTKRRGIPDSSDSKSRARSELVLVLKTRAVNFVDKKRMPAEAAAAASAPMRIPVAGPSSADTTLQ